MSPGGWAWTATSSGLSWFKPGSAPPAIALWRRCWSSTGCVSPKHWEPAIADGQTVGVALAFRNDGGVVTLRIVAVVAAFRHRGVGRRLVERIETEAALLGAEAIGLGTDDAVGFWFHLGYTAILLFHWVYDADLYHQESETVLCGPLAGVRHWRSAFQDIPQLYVELDESRLDLRQSLGDTLRGCHVGFMMSKNLTPLTHS